MIKKKSYIKKEDKVKVVAGKDKGKIGKVLRVIGKKNSIVVENVNIAKHHTKPSASNKQGGIVEKESPIHYSNLMLMCTKCVNPVRVKIQKLDDGKKVRVCRKCNEIIDA